MANHFKLLNSFDVEYAPAAAKKWRSSRTGLQATLIAQECPIISGYFAVATEVENDSGAPHTLEHLVFTGSKKYPYKGVLDILGNLNFSTTNAWTSTDKTVYTLDTAGWQGFKKMLPVYLDHILNPTLSDEACYTEVYHVDGEGKDKGVVYSEMEGIQYTSWFQADLVAARAMYDAKSGYSSETGGLLESLRVLTNDQIREFHQNSYRPDNLCVIVTGSVNEKEFLDTLAEFDATLPELPNTPKLRPFVDSPEPYILKENTIKEIEFPDTDESSGMIEIFWQGPHVFDTVNALAVGIVLSYLTENSVSLLQSKIVEIDDPLANEIVYLLNDYKNISYALAIEGVPTERLKECDAKVHELIKEHVDNNLLDLDRIRSTLESTRLNYVYSCEESAQKLASEAIGEFVYGKMDGSDLNMIKDMQDFEALAKWTADDWTNFIKQRFVDEPHVSVIATPSAEMYETKQVEDEKLVKDRIAKLGEEGLAKLADELKQAEKINDAQVPKDLIEEFSKKDLTSIKFIKTQPVITTRPELSKTQYPELHNHIFKDLPENFPLEIYFDGFKSNFVTIKLLFSSVPIPQELIPYMFIFFEIFSNPLTLDDGTEVNYEDVVDGLKKDLVSHNIRPDAVSIFDELIEVSLTAQTTKYDKAIEWAGNVLFNSKFDIKRIKVAIEKFINSLSSKKRDGQDMVDYLSNKYLMGNRSLTKAHNILEVEDFYHELLENIDSKEGFAKIHKDLETIRESLFGNFNNYRVLTIGGIEKLEAPVKAWLPFVEKVAKHSTLTKQQAASQKEQKLIEVPHGHQFLSEEGKNLGGKAYILATPGSESSYLTAVGHMDANYLDRDYALIDLVRNYLQVTEGPFWRGIRGSGLAYTPSVYLDGECKELYLSLYRATDAIAAYETAKKIVLELANGTVKFDQALVDGAISTIVNSFTSRESNFVDAAIAKYCDAELRGRGGGYRDWLFKQLNDVSHEELVRVTKQYFVPMFDSKSSAVFVAFNPKNIKISEQLEKLGYEVHQSEVEAGDDDSEFDTEEESDSEED